MNPKYPPTAVKGMAMPTIMITADITISGHDAMHCRNGILLVRMTWIISVCVSAVAPEEMNGTIAPDTFLAPLTIDEKNDSIGACANQSRERCSDKGFLSISMADYLELLDASASQVRADKIGYIPSEVAPIGPSGRIAISDRPRAALRLIAQRAKTNQPRAEQSAALGPPARRQPTRPDQTRPDSRLTPGGIAIDSPTG